MAKGWMKRAQGDLKNAQHTLTLPDAECPFETVCFHAQQCAEKSLKAVLTLHGVVFKRIHDLKELLRLCDGIEPLSGPLGPVGDLSPYATEARYPEDEEGEEPISRAQAEEAVALARKVYDLIQRKLGAIR